MYACIIVLFRNLPAFLRPQSIAKAAALESKFAKVTMQSPPWQLSLELMISHSRSRFNSSDFANRTLLGVS